MRILVILLDVLLLPSTELPKLEGARTGYCGSRIIIARAATFHVRAADLYVTLTPFPDGVGFYIAKQTRGCKPHICSRLL